MIHYNTLGHNLKRGIINFCAKISSELPRPAKKFVADMVYGLTAAQSCHLTKIARKLKEDVALEKTVERLSRNLMNFDNEQQLHKQYFDTVKKTFDAGTVLIIDDSDIAKPCSSKLEGLCKVHDGSTGEIATGYWYAGVSALSSGRRQPIPVYGRVYSTAEDGYKSNNDETIKSLAFLSTHFSKSNIRAFDRGYDAGYVFDYLIPRNESFIVRMQGNRNVIYKGKTVLLSALVNRFKGKFSLKFTGKSGRQTDCKVSVVTVTLPNHKDTPLNLVICRGLGQKPLMLLTNVDSNDKRLGVTISKVYLMRWRIEEYYKFKKQTFGFEKFLVRSLKSIRNLDLLLSIAIGYIGLLSTKINESRDIMEVIEASKRLYDLSRFVFYALADGLREILSKSYTGIRSFFARPTPSCQLSLWRTL